MDHATLSNKLTDMRDFTDFVTVFVLFNICANLSVESLPDADAVNFPGSQNYMTISPCPSKQIFCDRIDDYPRNVHIDDRLLANKLIKQKIFDDNFVQTRLGIQTRIGEERRACDTRRDVVYPKKARNTKGQYVFIVNDSQYRQAVEIEKCLNEGEKCLTDDDAPVSRRTLCKQIFATYKLYAITANREQVYDSFSLPSACLCHYKTPTSFRSSLKPRKRNNLPLCKAGTKLNFRNTNYEEQQNQVQVKRPTNRQQAPPRSISGQLSSGIKRPRGQNRESNKNRRRNRRNRRIHQYTRPYRHQPDSRGHIWQRDTRVSRLYTESECSRDTYCVSPGDYPTDRVVQVMQGSSEVYKQVFDSQCSNIIATRGFAIDEDPLCSGVQRLIFPRKARNMENKWKFVVNIDNFTQSIEIEECDDRFVFSQESGDQFGDCLYSGSQGNNPEFTACKQIYTEHKLLALTETGQLEVDRFMLPSACACFIQPFFGLLQL